MPVAEYAHWRGPSAVCALSGVFVESGMRIEQFDRWRAMLVGGLCVREYGG